MVNICPSQMSVEKAKMIQVGPRVPGAPEDRAGLIAWIRRSLAQAKTLEELGPALRDFVALVGFDNFNVAVYAPGINAEELLYIYNGYDIEWWKIYYERRYVDFDPIMAKSVERATPYEWHEIDFSKAPPEAALLFQEAMRFKICGGYSTRVVGPYGVQVYASVSTETPGKVLGEQRDEVFSISLMLMSEFVDAFLRVIQKTVGLVEPTERQLLTLQLAADGLPHKTIAAQLGVVERTVDDHIKKALVRMHRKNRSSAIALAAQMGLIIRDIPSKIFDPEEGDEGAHGRKPESGPKREDGPEPEPA